MTKDEIEADLEKERTLSEQNRPPYFNWLKKEKKEYIILAIFGTILAIFGTIALIKNWSEFPAVMGIIGVVTVWGFVVGIVVIPINIYRGLKKLDYWSPNSAWNKDKDKFKN